MSGNLPERVRQAMRPEIPDGEHPSADVLNAYGEHNLPASEAQNVLQHLSSCAECRETLYLAGEAVEEPAMMAHAAAAPVRRVQWWTWAVPSLGALTVGLAIFFVGNQPLKQRRVLTASIHNEQRNAPAPTAEEQAPKPSVDTTAVATKQRNIEQKRAVTAAKQATSRRDRQDLEKDQALQNVPAMAANATPLEPGTGGQYAKAAPSAAVVAVPPSPAAPALTDSLDEKVVNSVAKKGEELKYQAQSKPKTSGVIGGVAAESAGARPSEMVYRSTNSGPLAVWRVAPNGGLEHIVLGAWQPVSDAPSVRFQTVSNVGTEVWAAAKGPKLFRSGDDGVHWQQLSLPPEASGEINSIRLTTPVDAVIQLSGGTAWSTHDGGHSWSRVEGQP